MTARVKGHILVWVTAALLMAPTAHAITGAKQYWNAGGYQYWCQLTAQCQAPSQNQVFTASYTYTCRVQNRMYHGVTVGRSQMSAPLRAVTMSGSLEIVNNQGGGGWTDPGTEQTVLMPVAGYSQASLTWGTPEYAYMQVDAWYGSYYTQGGTMFSDNQAYFTAMPIWHGHNWFCVCDPQISCP